MIMTLSRLVAQVESANCKFVMRYEPSWNYVTRAIIDRFHDAHRPVRMSPGTALVLLSTSWGKYQIMGSVLYEMGYAGHLTEFADSEYLQDQYYDVYVKRRNIDYTLAEILNDKEKREHFAHRYNGDKKVYSQRLLNVYTEMMKGN